MKIVVKDNSDRGGLKEGQHINVSGYPGRWKVVKVWPEKDGLRGYDVERLPNRQQRRKAKATRKETV